MNKLFALTVLALVPVLMVVAGGDQEAEAGDVSPTFTAAFATIHVEGTPQVEAMERFTQEVLDRTDGAVEITVFPGGALGGNVAVFEGVLSGSMEMGSTGIIAVARTAPEYVGVEMPFMIRGTDHLTNVLYGPIGDEMSEAVAANSDLMLLGFYSKGPRYLMTNDLVVSEPSDLDGLQLRIPPIPMFEAAWSELGATPIRMSLPEVYTGMQTGVVDGLEQDIAPFLAQALYEVTDHVMLTDHMPNIEFLIINKAWFDSLPAEYQQAVQESADAAVQFAAELIADQTDALFAEMEATGVEIHEIDQEAFWAVLEEPTRTTISQEWAPGLYQRILDAAE